LRRSYSVREYVKVAEAHRAYLDSAIGEVKRLRASQVQSIAELRRTAETTLDELVGALLPTASEGDIGRAVALTGAIGVQRALADVAQQRGELERAASAVPHPRSQQAVQRLLQAERELKTGLDKLVKDTDRDEDFIELKTSHFGTQEYSGGLLKPGSWNDSHQWKELQKRFPGHADFPALVAAVEKARKDTGVAAEIQKLETELEAIQASARLASPELDPLTAARSALRNHLAATDHQNLGAKLAETPFAEAFARYTGPLYQAKAIETLSMLRLSQAEAALQKERAQLEREIIAKRREVNSGRYTSRQALVQRFSDRASLYHGFGARYCASCDRLASYQNYNSGLSFWEVWFWLNVLNDLESQGNAPPDGFQAGGGEYGGAGASGDWGREVDVLNSPNAQLFADPELLPMLQADPAPVAFGTREEILSASPPTGDGALDEADKDTADADRLEEEEAERADAVDKNEGPVESATPATPAANDAS
jgi:hypothetical protein